VVIDGELWVIEEPQVAVVLVDVVGWPEVDGRWLAMVHGSWRRRWPEKSTRRASQPAA
jgi:hypothetical protein